MLENWNKRLAYAVDLVATIEFNVLRCDFPVKSQIASCPCRRHTEALNQVWAPNITEEVELEVDVGQPLALGKAQILDPFRG